MEFLNIIISKNNCKQVGIILDRIVGSSDPELLVDQVSDLSSTKETVLFLGFLFLQTDLSLELGIMDDLGSVLKQSSHRVLQKNWHSNSSYRTRRSQFIH